MNMTDASRVLIRWRLCLSEFDFEIKYRKAMCNAMDDGSSCFTTEGGTMVDVEEYYIPYLATEEEK